MFMIPSGGFGPPETIYSATLNSDTADLTGNSYRNLAAVTGAGPWHQVRVTFEAGATGTMRAGNVSIGVRDATYVTTTAPVELLFSGISGFTITAGNTLVSDWANLTVTSADELLVIYDVMALSAIARYINSGTGVRYYKAAAGYDAADPGSPVSSDAITSQGFNKIEARTAF